MKNSTSRQLVLIKEPWEHPAIAEMRYEIREIVTVASNLKSAGLEISWENIGDPVHRGHQVPEWMRNVIKKDSLDFDESYAYVPSQGNLRTRKFLANQTNKRSGAKITETIYCFSMAWRCHQHTLSMP